MSLVADTALPVNSPPSFHLLAKPSGATCNIDCKYCFFLSKDPNDNQRMSENTLETYIQQLLESHRTPQVTVAWQGGVMALTAAEDGQRGPYRPCPCGSGRKFRFCHGNNAPRTPFSGVNPAADAPQNGRVTLVHDEPQTVSDAAYGAST
jgi:SEC-C motif